MYDAHAHDILIVAGRTGSGSTQSLTFGRIRHGDSVQQLLSLQNVETRCPVEMLIANLDALGIERALLQGPFYGTTNEYQAAALARVSRQLGATCGSKLRSRFDCCCCKCTPAGSSW